MQGCTTFLQSIGCPLVILLSLAACSDDGAGGSGSLSDGGDGSDANLGDGSGTTGDASNSTAGSGGSTATGNGGNASGGSNGTGCEPPDMLLVLDRTMSMHRTPDGAPAENTAEGRMESKWYLAIDAIESLTRELDTTIRFGLELFPVDPGMGQCVTLSERIEGTTAKNPQCEAGEVLVSPAADTSDAIDAALEPEITRLCRSTPIGAGLVTAREELATLEDPDRKRFALLLTDGRDTCDEDLSLATAQGIAEDGAALYVIGFDGSGSGIDNGHLNDLACAGRTAKGFPEVCVEDDEGHFTALDRSGPALYIVAEDQAQLRDELDSIAGEVCCGCII